MSRAFWLGMGAGVATWLLLRPRRAWRFQLPLRNSTAEVTDGWWSARSGDRHHEGLDFAVPVGTPVYAIDSGTVVTADDVDNDVSGKYVLLGHSWGSSLYAHLDKLAVKKGRKVGVGTLIGYSGRTGIQYSAPHLHFGVFVSRLLLGSYQSIHGKPSTGWGRTTWRDEVAVPSEPLFSAVYSAAVAQRARSRGIPILV